MRPVERREASCGLRLPPERRMAVGDRCILRITLTGPFPAVGSGRFRRCPEITWLPTTLASVQCSEQAAVVSRMTARQPSIDFVWVAAAPHTDHRRAHVVPERRCTQ